MLDNVQRPTGSHTTGKVKPFLAIDSRLGPDALTLTRVDGEDALSRCFVYRLTVVTEEPEAVVRTVLGTPVTVWLAHDDPHRRRPIHGHVRRITSETTASGRPGAPPGTVYRMEIVPRLWFLSRTTDCRIFQNQSVPDILRAIFADHGVAHVQFRIIADEYQPLEYCVQFQESALNFVSRLMEHLGLFYWHEHEAGRHTLVIADRNAAAAPSTPATVAINPAGHVEALRSLDTDCSFRSGKWTLNDYNFHSPTRHLMASTPTVLTVPAMRDHEIYEFPGGFRDIDSGNRLTRMRMEYEEANHIRVSGVSNCVGFEPGRIVKVTGAPGTRPTAYLLIEVRHRATSAALGVADGEPDYHTNEYVAIPADTPFRPERSAPKPVVRGPQTAVVVGPAAESIHCDEYGRVRVQFHWDRRGTRKEDSSCWIRVAQSRSGSFYGTLAVPHVGHEVLVSFLDGDPDRPLIIGTVPNALAMPPVDLPASKHKTVQRDHGDNKLVMHGKSGQEHITMSSPRMMNHFVGGYGARSLSAAAAGGAWASADGSGVVFNLGAAPRDLSSGSVSAQQTTIYGDVPGSVTEGETFTYPANQTDDPDNNDGSTSVSVTIPNFMDGLTLSALGSAWSTNDTNGIERPAFVYATSGDAVPSLYGSSNTVAAGDINSITMTQRHNWTVGETHTWNGDTVYTRNEKDINTLTMGGVVLEVGGPVTNTYISDVNTVVEGTNTSTVLGASTSTVLGAAEAFLLANDLKINMAAVEQFFLGLRLQYIAGLNIQIHNGPYIERKGVEICKSAATIRSAEAVLELSNVSARSGNVAIENIEQKIYE